MSALLLALSVAVPIVERADLDRREHWESEHQTGVCTPAHDHTICTQVGANLSLPAHVGVPIPVLHEFRGLRGTGSTYASPRLLALGNPTRAPPSV